MYNPMSYGMGGMGYGFPSNGMGTMPVNGVPPGPGERPSPVFLLRDFLRTAGESVALIQGFKLLMSTVSQWTGNGASYASAQVVNNATDALTKTLAKKGRRRSPMYLIKMFSSVFIGCFLFYAVWKQWRLYRRIRGRALLKARGLIADRTHNQQEVTNTQQMTETKRVSADSILEGMSKGEKALYACWSNIVAEKKNNNSSLQNTPPLSPTTAAPTECFASSSSQAMLLNNNNNMFVNAEKSPQNNKPIKPYLRQSSTDNKRNNIQSSDWNSDAVTSGTKNFLPASSPITTINNGAVKQQSTSKQTHSLLQPPTSAFSSISALESSCPATPVTNRGASSKNHAGKVKHFERRKESLSTVGSKNEIGHGWPSSASSSDIATGSGIRRSRRREAAAYWSVFE